MLTDSQIRNLKASDKVYRKADKQGLCIEVRTNGKKFWRYRFYFDGKATMMTFGEYPSMSLVQARERHAKARALLQKGINPVIQEHQTRQKAKEERADFFVYHAENFLEKMAQKGRSSGYIAQVRHNLNTYILPVIGKKPIKQIDSIDIIEIMRRTTELVKANTKKRGTGEVTAILCRQQTGLIFRNAMRTVPGLFDPTVVVADEIERPPIEHARDLTLTELKELLNKLNDYGGMPSTKGVLWTMIYTMCRTKEARFMRWKHIDFERKIWNIPLAEIARRKKGERNIKMDRPHIVPLSNQMIELLQKMYPISGLGEFVFPSNKTPTNPIGATTINSALSYMGIKDTSGHDLRATGSTYLHAMGYHTDHINLQMAHVDNSVSGIYNHAIYLPERTQMLQDWADYLDNLKQNVG